MPRRFSGSVGAVIVGLVGATIAMSFLPWFFTSDQSRLMIYADESGLFEEISLGLWVALAIVLLFIIRPLSWRVVAGSVVALAAGAREASWHKAFTPESVLKFSYYLDNSYPVLERLGIGLVVLVVLVCIGVVAVTLFHHLRAQGYLRPVWGQLLLVFVVAMVVSKVLDRTPNILDVSFGLPLPSLAQHMMQAAEEGLEMLLPIILGAAALAFTHGRGNQLAAQQAEPAWQN